MAEAMDVDEQPVASSSKEEAKSKSYELPWVSCSYFRELTDGGKGCSRRVRCGSSRSNKLLQVEKYRPTLISEIVGNKEATERLQVISEEGNMPNIILAVCCRVLILVLKRSILSAAGHLQRDIPSGAARHRQDDQHNVSVACSAGVQLQECGAGTECIRR